MAALRGYLDMSELGTDWEAIEEASDAMLVNSLAMLCPFEPREKQALLECRDTWERGELIATLMEMATLGQGTESPQTRQ